MALTISIKDGNKNDPKTFSSCYFALIFTTRDPQLLWEFNDPSHMGFTTSFPAVARIGTRPTPVLVCSLDPGPPRTPEKAPRRPLSCTGLKTARPGVRP